MANQPADGWGSGCSQRPIDGAGVSALNTCGWPDNLISIYDSIVLPYPWENLVARSRRTPPSNYQLNANHFRLSLARKRQAHTHARSSSLADRDPVVPTSWSRCSLPDAVSVTKRPFKRPLTMRCPLCWGPRTLFGQETRPLGGQMIIYGPLSAPRKGS